MFAAGCGRIQKFCYGGLTVGASAKAERAWIAESQAVLRVVLRLLGPILRPVLRTALKLQRRAEGRGPYADPWTLIENKYGPAALAQSD